MKLSLSTLLTLSLAESSLTSPTPRRSSPDDLTLQAATHVIYSYEGTTPPDEFLPLIEAGKVGGLIIFGDNVDSSLPDTIQSFQDAFASSPAAATGPLLIMTDQEGGQVVRLPGGPSQSAKEVGASADPEEAATNAGQKAAEVLAKYAHNSNLAPVLDVFRKPGDFEDQYERSFSNDSSVVAQCGAAFISAQQSGGALATVKHFPGLGAASAEENTDERPVTLNLTLEELQRVDEAPYSAAIDAGVALVMPSWAVYPALDNRPSGLSEKWIQGELRDRLGFKGVTISDAIEAGGLEGYGEDPERAVLASQAGMDLILAAGRDISQGESIVDALVEAVQDGTLDQQAWDDATGRIADLRASLT